MISCLSSGVNCVYGRNAQEALSAAPVVLKLTTDNPFRGMDLFETDEGGLVVRSSYLYYGSIS